MTGRQRKTSKRKGLKLILRYSSVWKTSTLNLKGFKKGVDEGKQESEMIKEGEKEGEKRVDKVGQIHM